MYTNNQIDAVADKLEARLLGGLAALPVAMTTASVGWINAPFTTPSNTPWMRTSIVNFGPIEQDASGCYETNAGVYSVQVFWPKFSGGRACMRQAQAVKSLYTAEIFDDVVVTSVTVSPGSEPQLSGLGAPPLAQWFGVTVTVNFTFEGFTS